jgi:NAD(P)-dependent dehydrogenase (short-subunit alcohol dehydrogenase family)
VLPVDEPTPTVGAQWQPERMEIDGKVAVVTGAAISAWFVRTDMRSDDDVVALLDLNLRGPMLATQLAPEPMGRAGGGAVINLGSTAGVGLGPHVSPEYAAAKAGLIQLLDRG